MKHFWKTAVAALCALGVAASACAEMEVIVPEAYQKTGTLPVYRAAPRDFTTQRFELALLDASGILPDSVPGEEIRFQSGGVLTISPEAMFYSRYDGTYERTDWDEERGVAHTETLPKQTLDNEAADLASWMLSGWPGTGERFSLEKEQLTAISLSQAKERVEALLSELSLTGYTCAAALDMSVARIQEMGGRLTALAREGVYQTNSPLPDYSAAGEAEEGYCLQYVRYGTDGDFASTCSVQAYVTSSGIVQLSLRDSYLQGEVYDTPSQLAALQTVLDALPGEMAASAFPEKLHEVKRATLTWQAMRAPQKQDGMVLSPVWVVLYQSEEAVQRGDDCWATFSAVDGRLISAIFR